MKVKITEEEKLSILGLHNENYVVNKKLIEEQFNPQNGVYYVQYDQGLKASIDFNTTFPRVIKKGTPIFHDYKSNNTKIVLGNTGVVTYCDKDVFIYNDSITDLKNDPFLKVIKATFCNGNTLKTWSQLTKGGKVEPPRGKAPDGSELPDKKDASCKTKNPYNAFVDAGLNWKVERQKWIDAKCNGTTPCILGNAATNINLRNALCDGTWPMKKDEPKTPEQPVASPEQPAVSTEQPPVNNVVNNTTTQLKQFPNLTFGVRTQ